MMMFKENRRDGFLLQCTDFGSAKLSGSCFVHVQACRELEHSPRLHSLLEVVLRIGNFLNRCDGKHFE